MSENTQAALRQPRLNPFAFPADTDLRFVLLIVSILGSSLFIYGVLNDFFQYPQFVASLNCIEQYPNSYTNSPTYVTLM